MRTRIMRRPKDPLERDPLIDYDKPDPIKKTVTVRSIARCVSISLPKEVRLAIGINPGDMLAIEVIGQSILISKLDKLSELSEDEQYEE
jgi:bifunctional DNA-binding transcriptional regulator/antitoxin component of YhaV-PrlF toxin-antitoxin module